jgi:REP element-mobilizing transposase RayT
MDRYWLLTSTFYGNWLPGDPRGFVSRVRDTRPDDPPSKARHEHDIPGTPYDEDLRGLYHHAQGQLKCPPIRIDQEQAQALLAQFQETASIRRWELLAAAIMSNHLHLVVGVNGNPCPKKVLGDFKAYGSRVLSKRAGKPSSGTWWTYGGSRRKLPTEESVRAAIEYVLDQPHALVIWIAPDLR